MHHDELACVVVVRALPVAIREGKVEFAVNLTDEAMICSPSA